MNITLKNLVKQYKDKTVLDIREHSIKQHKITGIVGPNGAGKSTLVKIIGGLEPSSGGIVLYDGEKEFKKKYKDITVVFQQPYLLATNVYNNIAYPMKIRKIDKKEISRRVEELMKDMEIEDLRNQKSNTLSGGEKQKVSLARAISFHPSLLILDEFTANIDPNYLTLMEGIIKKVNTEQKTTIIIVTHNLHQAKRLCDAIIVMDKGKIIEEGNTQDILNNPKHIITQNLINQEFMK